MLRVQIVKESWICFLFQISWRSGDATKASSGTSLCTGSGSSEAPGINTKVEENVKFCHFEVRDHAGRVSENLVVRFWKPKTETKRTKLQNKTKVEFNQRHSMNLPTKVMLVSGRVAEGEEALFENDGEDLGDFEMHEQIDQ